MTSASGKCPVRRIRPRRMSAMGTEPCGRAAGIHEGSPKNPHGNLEESLLERRWNTLCHSIRGGRCMDNTTIVVIAVVAALVVLAVVWMVMQQRRRAHL